MHRLRHNRRCTDQDIVLLSCSSNRSSWFAVPASAHSSMHQLTSFLSLVQQPLWIDVPSPVQYKYMYITYMCYFVFFIGCSCNESSWFCAGFGKMGNVQISVDCEPSLSGCCNATFLGAPCDVLAAFSSCLLIACACFGNVCDFTFGVFLSGNGKNLLYACLHNACCWPS